VDTSIPVDRQGLVTFHRVSDRVSEVRESIFQFLQELIFSEIDLASGKPKVQELVHEVCTIVDNCIAVHYSHQEVAVSLKLVRGLRVRVS